jgi:prepilin-type N-terminal cleavage/methylation domain-containing protein
MRNRRESGYSLPEMLTVIAIVGALALVSVPAFLTFMQSNKMKSSIRNLTTDLRSARQRSISQGQQVMVTFQTGADKRRYDLYQGDQPFNSVNWRQTNLPENLKYPRYMDDIIYFPAQSGATPQTFTDTVTCAALPCTAGTDSKLDVIFFPDGRVQLPAGLTVGTITVKTDRNIPKSQYTVTITPSGRVQAN